MMVLGGGGVHHPNLVFFTGKTSLDKQERRNIHTANHQRNVGTGTQKAIK